MIPNYHFYDGAALSFITTRGEFTALTRIGDLAGRAYALNHDRRVYIKHATNDASPWLFTFAPEHQGAIRDLFRVAGDAKTFVVLVCGRVGVCALKYGEYAAALGEDFGAQRTLTITRPPGGSFHVHGAAGAVGRAIPRTYKFDAAVGKQTIASMIGNALPPEFVRRHAITVKQAIVSHATQVAVKKRSDT